MDNQLRYAPCAPATDLAEHPVPLRHIVVDLAEVKAFGVGGLQQALEALVE